MDESEQRQFIGFLAKELKDCARELMTYQLFVHLLKQSAAFSGIEELLEAARKSPVLQARFEKDFEGFDEMLPQAGPSHMEKVKELLEKWKPKGRVTN